VLEMDYNSLTTDKKGKSYRAKVNYNCLLTWIDELVHGCDEANIKGIRISHDNQSIC
jgi:hypothetical protein